MTVLSLNNGIILIIVLTSSTALESKFSSDLDIVINFYKMLLMFFKTSIFVSATISTFWFRYNNLVHRTSKNIFINKSGFSQYANRMDLTYIKRYF